MISGNDRLLEYIEQHLSNMYKARNVENFDDYLDKVGLDFPKLTSDEYYLLEGAVTLKGTDPA